MSGGAPVISVSVSEASDLGRLGFLPDELDRVLAALITPLIHGGFRIAYGGRLEGRGNFTTQMSARVAETYVPHALILGARPFIHVLAPHRVAALPRESLLAHAHILGAHAELWLMGAGESVRGVAGLDTQEVNGTRVVGVRLGGHLKTGQSWTGQNRPVGERPKHECSTPFARESASPRATPAG